MATETTLQVSESSEDVAGISVVTASRNKNTPRSGVIYNPTTLAAAVPVWFHPLQDGGHLAVFSRLLTGATLASRTAPDGTLLYSTAAVDAVPRWAVIASRTGSLSDLRAVPSEQPGTRTLRAAFSRGEYLFLLSEYRTSPDAPEVQSLLQNFRITAQQGIELIGEETVPLALRLGLYVDRRHLWVFGATPTGKLGMARKNWGRIGTSPTAGAVEDWQFWGQGNWTPQPSLIAALIDYSGAEIPADGPCSMSRRRDTFYLAATISTTYPATTVAATTPPAGHTGQITTWTAPSPNLVPAKSWASKVYVSRKVDQAWREHGFAVDLAATTGLYQQGGVYLQEQLPITPGYGVIVAEASVTTLDGFSDRVQVLTGTSPHTLVLPPSATPAPAPLTIPAPPVSYLPYTIHNQSTSDIVVMAANRDRAITVPHGVGMVFTPYIAEPLDSRHWSWAYSAERAPRIRQGYPLVSTRSLVSRDYQLALTGGTTAGTFRLIHNGQVTPDIVFSSSTPAVTATAIRTALVGLNSISEATVTATGSTFAITVDDDSAQLGLYAYRLVGGSAPQVTLTPGATRLNWLTRWSVFEPTIKPAVPSGLAPAATPNPVTPTPPTALNPLLAQFTSVINVVTSGVVAVTAGVIGTVTNIISQAVRLITGSPVEENRTTTATVTTFLQNLAGGGVTDNSATSFENILRQITGGTGRTETATTSPFQFVQTAISAAVDVVENIFETLSEWFQEILNAILGR